MSIVRWSEDSSLYIYEDSRGYVTCFACHFMIDPDEPRDEDGFYYVTNSFNTTDVEAMVEHVQRHREAGDVVPVGLEERVRDRWPEEYIDKENK